ncbi:hypothetical protein CEXT_473831 [Caerostris extrusa]|uniref:Uncharacterized protein n=1 Tax=Caerostris extrusa TaxID=172846 RepID=A0AAV4UME5_CAEEX|nr:hypothetical protein CEXT_473831 [Caerostris extrusa]
MYGHESWSTISSCTRHRFGKSPTSLGIRHKSDTSVPYPNPVNLIKNNADKQQGISASIQKNSQGLDCRTTMQLALLKAKDL